MTFPIFPAAASRVAEQTDHLYWGLIVMSLVALLIVICPLAYFLIKYRQNKPADRSPARLPQNTIEITWTLVPTVVMLCFYAWAARQYLVIERPPPGAMEIHVIGKQWMWKVQHLEGNREINELHVPAGRVVKLIMTSQDVIHSFYLPEFRIKQDVVPGRYTTQWFKAARPGKYHIYCSEFCGTHHSGMIGWVEVMNPAAYEDWLERGRPGSTLIQQGEQLYRELGCSGCHSGSSVVRSPPLEGVFNKPVPLNGGELVIADEMYLRDSILFPAKQIAGGYTNLMPSFQGRITEDELLKIVSYLKSLGTAAPSVRNTLEGPP
jgi:cytochrome c oxidase subunit 2